MNIVKTFQISFLAITSLLLLSANDCGSSSSPAPAPLTGFTVNTWFQPAISAPMQLYNNVSVEAYFDAPLDGTQNGSIATQKVLSKNGGHAFFPGAKIPARWKISWLYPPAGSCAQTGHNYVFVNFSANSNYFDLQCVYPVLLAISPRIIDISSPPDSLTVTAQVGYSFNANAGRMPEAQVVDVNGIVAAVGDASSISPDGSSIQVSTPGIYSARLGTYYGVAGNLESDGGLHIVGAGSVQVINRYPNCGKGGPCPP